MTEGEFGAHRRLEQLQDALARQIGSFGRGLRDIAHLPLSRELLADVETCIRAQDAVVIDTGLYVLQGLVIERPIEDLPAEFRDVLVARIEQLLDHPADRIAQAAINWYAQLRGAYPRYRERMLALLASTNAAQRRLALRYYETFAHAAEIRPLLHFVNDAATTELHPNGDWRYVLRDRALERIEEQLGTRFERTLRREPHRGATVVWFDWSPVRDWLLAERPARESRRRVKRTGSQLETPHRDSSFIARK